MGLLAGLGGCHPTEDFTGHVRGGQSDGVIGAGLHGYKVVLDVKLRIPGRDFICLAKSSDAVRTR